MATKPKKENTWPVIRLVTRNGQKRWMVDGRLGADGKQGGSRYFFETKTEAEAKADSLRVERGNTGTLGVAMPERLRLQAMDAARRLAVVGAEIPEAVDYFLAHAKPTAGAKLVKDVAAEFLRLKREAGRRETYLRKQGYVLGNVFAEEFGERNIHEIGHVEIEDWMDKQEWTLRTRRNYVLDLGNFFNFSIRRGYCSRNPLAQIERPKIVPKPPGILTIDEAKAILATAKKTELLPAVAIGLFCGLRSAELERLEWRHVRADLATVEVTAENAKMSERRIVNMPENLVSILKPIAKEIGQVAPVKRFDLHLWRLWKAAKMERWPKNAMRHSFASYHFAHHKNAAATMAELGHFGSSQSFINSYRGVVQPSEAAKYWEIVV